MAPTPSGVPATEDAYGCSVPSKASYKRHHGLIDVAARLDDLLSDHLALGHEVALEQAVDRTLKPLDFKLQQGAQRPPRRDRKVGHRVVSRPGVVARAKRIEALRSCGPLLVAHLEAEVFHEVGDPGVFSRILAGPGTMGHRHTDNRAVPLRHESQAKAIGKADRGRIAREFKTRQTQPMGLRQEQKQSKHAAHSSRQAR